MLKVKNKSTYALVVLMFVAACGPKTVDKNAELDNLIKEQAAVNEKIRLLRAELEKKGEMETKARRIETSDIKPSLFIHYIEVQAKVDGDQNVNVAPQIPGTVVKVDVTPGQQVTKGQRLASLDDAILLQGIKELQTQIDFATTVFNKQKSLWDRKIGTQMQYLTAENNMKALENKMATLREQVRMSQIVSPINGTVDNVSIKAGQAIAPGMPCINVVNLNGLKVKGELAESYIDNVKTGDAVVIKFPDNDIEINAKATYVSKVINALTRTFTVEVRLDDAPSGLRPGMVAVMKVADYKKEATMSVPVSNIQTDENGNYVMVVVNQNGKPIARKKSVQTGNTYGGKVEITEGLVVGDKLISKGFQGLNEGQEVEF